MKKSFQIRKSFLKTMFFLMIIFLRFDNLRDQIKEKEQEKYNYDNSTTEVKIF